MLGKKLPLLAEIRRTADVKIMQSVDCACGYYESTMQQLTPDQSLVTDNRYYDVNINLWKIACLNIAYKLISSYKILNRF